MRLSVLAETRNPVRESADLNPKAEKVALFDIVKLYEDCGLPNVYTLDRLDSRVKKLFEVFGLRTKLWGDRV